MTSARLSKRAHVFREGRGRAAGQGAGAAARLGGALFLEAPEAPLL
mgnify:CR=1 FL=1